MQTEIGSFDKPVLASSEPKSIHAVVNMTLYGLYI